MPSETSTSGHHSVASGSASMKAGILAVTALGRAQGIHRISAGNYGGKLGKYHFKLREILAS